MELYQYKKIITYKTSKVFLVLSVMKVFLVKTEKSTISDFGLIKFKGATQTHCFAYYTKWHSFFFAWPRILLD